MPPMTLREYIARLQTAEARFGNRPLPIYVLDRTTPLPDDEGLCPDCGEAHDHRYSLRQIVALRVYPGGEDPEDSEDYPCVWLVTADADETIHEPPRFPADE